MEPNFDLTVIRPKRPEALESDAGCTHAFRRFLFVHPASSAAQTADCINIEVERVDD